MSTKPTKFLVGFAIVSLLCSILTIAALFYGYIESHRHVNFLSSQFYEHQQKQDEKDAQVNDRLEELWKALETIVSKLDDPEEE